MRMNDKIARTAGLLYLIVAVTPVIDRRYRLNEIAEVVGHLE